MKKILFLTIISALLSLTLTGCSSKEPTVKKDNTLQKQERARQQQNAADKALRQLDRD